MVKKNKKGGSTIWNYNENISDKSVKITCHGSNIGVLFKLPIDVKIITSTKCGKLTSKLSTMFPISNNSKSKFLNHNRLPKNKFISTKITSLMNLPSTGFLNNVDRTKQLHIYKNGDIFPDICLLFSSIVLNSDQNKNTSLRQGFGIVGINENIKPILEKTNSNVCEKDYWYHSEFLSNLDNKLYNELKKICIGKYVLLSDILYILYQMGIKNFILDICRNWNIGPCAYDKYRFEFKKSEVNEKKYNINKLRNIEGKIQDSLDGRNTKLTRTFSGVVNTNEPNHIIQTSNFLKNNTLDDWEKISLNELVLKYSKKNITKEIGKTKKLQVKNLFNKMVGKTKKLQNKIK